MNFPFGQRPWRWSKVKFLGLFICIACIIICGSGQFRFLLQERRYLTIRERIRERFDTTPFTPSYEQLLLNAGPGTTATHALFEATCALGIPSIHWELYCVPFGTNITNVRLAFKYHDELINLLYRPNNSTATLEEYWDKVQSTMKKLLQQNIFLAYHDAPYPNFAQLFEDLHMELYNNKPPAFVLSKRDPKDWAMSRLEHHTVYMCKKNFDSLEMKDCFEAALQDGVQPKATGDTFDWHEVILELGQESRLTRKKTALIQGISYTFDEIYRGLDRGVSNHFAKYEPKSVLTLDLFQMKNDNQDTSASAIVKQLEAALPRSILDRGFGKPLRQHHRRVTGFQRRHEVSKRKKRQWYDARNQRKGHIWNEKRSDNENSGQRR